MYLNVCDMCESFAFEILYIFHCLMLAQIELHLDIWVYDLTSMKLSYLQRLIGISKCYMFVAGKVWSWFERIPQITAYHFLVEDLRGLVKNEQDL